jgi:hypothetical protein
LLAGLLAAVGLLSGRPLLAQEQSPQEPEVLGRGPVHEAFAQPVEPGELAPGARAPQPPPAALEEQKPEGGNGQWVPGYWQWDDQRGEFVWVTGAMREPPPGRKWVPGSYRKTDKGYEWVPGYWLPESRDSLDVLPVPPASLEEGPSSPAPGEGYDYVAGCWVWRDGRYAWRPGYWLRRQPGWVWHPSHHVRVGAGSLFVPGYWDYPLESRGVLFAPVAIARRPGLWTPNYTVSLSFLSGALFVRSGYRHYYYGDYFSPSYRQAGFTPWVDYRAGRSAVDPLWGYYRGARAGSSWERDLRGLYADRYAGRVAAPPRSLAQQATVLRSLPTTRTTTVHNVTVLKPLSQTVVTPRVQNVPRITFNHHPSSPQVVPHHSPAVRPAPTIRHSPAPISRPQSHSRPHRPHR